MLKPSPMPGYCFVVVAHSIDEGWERIFGHFPTEDLAWEAISWFWSMMSEAGYNDVTVVKTIKFNNNNNNIGFRVFMAVQPLP